MGVVLSDWWVFGWVMQRSHNKIGNTHNTHEIIMTQYTNTISTFKLLERFPTEESVRLYFEQKLWNNKPKCPSCTNQTPKQIYHHPSRLSLYRCKCCKTQFSVRNNSSCMPVKSR